MGLIAAQRRVRLLAWLDGWTMTRAVTRAARGPLYGALDLRDRFRGERDWYPPPRRVQKGNVLGDFVGIGRRFTAHLTELAEVTAGSRVLDIGCGAGRLAIPLTEVLGPDGSYEGFDVVPEAIEWCRSEITPRHPNFTFRQVDLTNPRYRPDGASPAAAYRFPYENGSFDVAVATSVFTHMLPAEVSNYVREAHRVLRPGGRLFATWYLLGADRPRAEGAAGDELAWFPVDHGEYRIVSDRSPGLAVAYPADRAVSLLRQTGFEITHLELGRWLGRDGRSWQDILVAEGGSGDD